MDISYHSFTKTKRDYICNFKLGPTPTSEADLGKKLTGKFKFDGGFQITSLVFTQGNQ